MRRIVILIALAGCQYRGDESVQVRPLFDGVSDAQPLSAYAVIVSWPAAIDNSTDQTSMRYSVWSADPVDMAHDFTTDQAPAVSDTGTLKALVGGLMPNQNYVFMAHATNLGGVRDKNVTQKVATTMTAPPMRTLTADVQPILHNTCSDVGQCHGPKNSAGAGMERGMDFSTVDSTLAALVNVPAMTNPQPGRLRVTPGDSGNSFIMNKVLGILGKDDGAQMPYQMKLGPLSPNQIRIISEWIDQGAMR
jgi:hypothetical protein